MQRPVDIKTLTELFDLMTEFPQAVRLVLPQDKRRAARLVEEGNREQWARVEFRELADWMRGTARPTGCSRRRWRRGFYATSTSAPRAATASGPRPPRRCWPSRRKTIGCRWCRPEKCSSES